MALMKCPECKKEISDKSQNCIYCGYPIKKENKKKKNIFPKAWLILCIMICLMISSTNFIYALNIKTLPEEINASQVYIMAFLALILGINYGVLLKTFLKKYFYLLLGINVIVLLYNILHFQIIINLLYILCAITNCLITFIILRKKLKDSKFNFKEYIPVFVTLIVAILLILIFSILGIIKKNINSNQRNENIPQIEIITDYINIRSERDIDSQILGRVHKGEIYDIISEDAESFYNWYEIKTASGIKGYIAGKIYDNLYVKKLSTNIKTTTKIQEESNEKQEEIKEETQETKQNVTKANNTNNTKANTSPASNTKNTTKNNNVSSTKAKKKTMDATKVYYCEQNRYTLKDDKCYLQYEADPLFYCPSGYTEYGLGECRTTEPTSVAASCTCSRGRLFGNNCVDNSYNTIGTPNCRCSDYRYYYDGMSCKMEDEYRYIEARQNGYYCSISQTNSNSSVCTDVVDAKLKGYSCPSGYTLNNTTCIEN